MSDVERYNNHNEADERGAYVHYIDYFAMQQQYDALAREVEALRADLQTTITTGLNMAEKGEKAMVYIEQLERQLAEAQQRIAEVVAALQKVMGHIENGTLVRDITRDGEADWTMRMLTFVQDLKQAEAALAAARGGEIET